NTACEQLKRRGGEGRRNYRDFRGVVKLLVGEISLSLMAAAADCARIPVMSQAASAITRPPAEVVRQTPVSQAPNGICYARSGDVTVPEADLERMVAAVPDAAAAALKRKAYYFVPLTVNQGDETVIADRYDVTLSDNAVCHRNLD